jgi:uncharacterized Zn finger protein (UPF0148 family)
VTENPLADDDLATLKGLRDRGILTEEEFQQKRALVFNSQAGRALGPATAQTAAAQPTPDPGVTAEAKLTRGAHSSQIDWQCPVCRSVQSVAALSTSATCFKCKRTFHYYACPVCHSTNCFAGHGRVTCPTCKRPLRIPRPGFASELAGKKDAAQTSTVVRSLCESSTDVSAPGHVARLSRSADTAPRSSSTGMSQVIVAQAGEGSKLVGGAVGLVVLGIVLIIISSAVKSHFALNAAVCNTYGGAATTCAGNETAYTAGQVLQVFGWVVTLGGVVAVIALLVARSNQARGSNLQSPAVLTSSSAVMPDSPRAAPGASSSVNKPRTATVIDWNCPSCGTLQQVPGSTGSLQCPVCSSSFGCFACPICTTTNCFTGQGRTACPTCTNYFRIPRPGYESELAGKKNAARPSTVSAYTDDLRRRNGTQHPT